MTTDSEGHIVWKTASQNLLQCYR